NPDFVVKALQDKGFRFSRHGSQLLVEPGSALTNDDRELIRKSKHHILATLPKNGENGGNGETANGSECTPPPGATWYFADARCRPCEAKDAHMWTWEGAKRWIYVKECPVPK